MIESGPRLAEAFYRRTADAVAPELLGKVLVARVGSSDPSRLVAGRIVETEAYLGEADLACHASKGLTKRTKTLYGPPGTAYVYLIYGMYDMLNVVVADEGEPQAVLVRAVELSHPVADLRAARGPGKLCRTFGITRALDASSLVDGPLGIYDGPAPARIAVSERVGVAYAGEWAQAPLRYFDPDSGAVSGPRSRLEAGSRARTRPSV